MTKREHEMMTVEGGGNNDAEEINTNDDDHEDEEEATPTNKNGNKKLITPPVKTKQKKKPRGSVKFEKKLLAIPHPQLCTVLATFLGNDIELQQRFVASLPAVDVTSLTIKLEQSARAIQKALPNSRYGSSSDHYGYKRASSAVTAYKKLWNEQVASLVDGGDKDAFVSYASDAVQNLFDAVDFNDEKDNKYKQLCAKKLAMGLKKTLKANTDLSDEARNIADDLLTVLARRYTF